MVLQVYDHHGAAPDANRRIIRPTKTPPDVIYPRMKAGPITDPK